eukprot:6558606-Alexandrium_andersonii.AAC.1
MSALGRWAGPRRLPWRFRAWRLSAPIDSAPRRGRGSFSDSSQRPWRNPGGAARAIAMGSAD